MGKLSIKDTHQPLSSNSLSASKGNTCNDIVIIKDETTLLMMNVISYMENKNFSQSQTEL